MYPHNILPFRLCQMSIFLWIGGHSCPAPDEAGLENPAYPVRKAIMTQSAWEGLGRGKIWILK